MKIEIDEEIKDILTKNQIARLFTVRVADHFAKYVEMDKEDFFKYMQEANDELREYIESGGGKSKVKRKKSKCLNS